MEKLNVKLTCVDNGCIVKDEDHDTLAVYEKKKMGDVAYKDAIRRALKEKITDYLADLIMDGSDDIEIKDSYTIKVDIE